MHEDRLHGRVGGLEADVTVFPVELLERDVPRVQHRDHHLAVVGNETIVVPEDLVGKRDTYVLRVKGDSMIDEQIRDGDFVVVEDRKTADNGEMVIALLRGSDVTLKKLYRDPGGKIRLQPANATMQPIFVEPENVQIQGVVVGVMRKY